MIWLSFLQPCAKIKQIHIRMQNANGENNTPPGTALRNQSSKPLDLSRFLVHIVCAILLLETIRVLWTLIIADSGTYTFDSSSIVYGEQYGSPLLVYGNTNCIKYYIQRQSEWYLMMSIIFCRLLTTVSRTDSGWGQILEHPQRWMDIILACNCLAVVYCPLL